MKIRYYTAKGSIYTRTRSEVGEYWIKEEPNGTLHPLAGGIHIMRRGLQELIDEYPRTLLDKTYCFNIGAEKEFFEDALRERCRGLTETEKEPTVIFFLVRHGDRYALGCSSEIVKIERQDGEDGQAENSVEAQ